MDEILVYEILVDEILVDENIHFPSHETRV